MHSHVLLPLCPFPQVYLHPCDMSCCVVAASSALRECPSLRGALTSPAFPTASVAEGAIPANGAGRGHRQGHPGTLNMALDRKRNVLLFLPFKTDV